MPTYKTTRVRYLLNKYGFVLGSYKPYQVRLYRVVKIWHEDTNLTHSLTFDQVYQWLEGYATARDEVSHGQP